VWDSRVERNYTVGQMRYSESLVFGLLGRHDQAGESLTVPRGRRRRKCRYLEGR
jgi:hypothetical protein